MPDQARRARPRTRLDPARSVAFAALLRVQREDAYLNLVLPRLFRQSAAQLDERDRAFGTELAHGTARLQGLYDAVLECRVTHGLGELQSEVLVALRLGCHQLLSMRVPAHAAVGTSVELVRESVGERPVRLVNAVLRQVAAKTVDAWVDDVAPSVHRDPIGHLAVRHAHPRWVVEAFAAQLPSLAEVEQALAADNVPAAVTLVVRPGAAEVAELIGAGAAAARWSPYAAILTAGGDPHTLLAVRQGRAGVQDEGSQLAAVALARAATPKPDRRWLDLCAGPGGKAALLTGLAECQGAVVVAVERQLHRAELVRQALQAYGDVAPVVAADGRRAPFHPASFDRVLVDVPCTGLGALRRRPESRWRRRPEDVETLVPLQRDLLRAALELVRPGGVVAYVTCSPVRAETRDVVDAVVAGGPVAAEELDVRPLLDGVPDLGEGRSVQLWPHRQGTDAMFIALLRRRAP